MKIKCLACDFENEEGSKYCKNCNEPLSKQSHSKDNPYIKDARNEDQPFELISDDQAFKITENKKTSNGGVIWGFLVVLIVGILMYSFIPSSKSSRPETSIIDLNARIGFSETQARIINDNSFDWTNVEFTINYNWDLETPIIKAGNTYIVGLGRFTSDDGEKFNPWTHRAEHFNVWCDIPNGNKGKYHCEPEK
ncbi:hypothetical protein ES708_24421 [subsurface metagenome]